MSKSILFEKRARMYAYREGPANAIRNAIGGRLIASVIFFLLPVVAAITVIVTGRWPSILIAILLDIPVMIWGQFWRDVDTESRSLIQVALAEIRHEIKEQGLNPAAPEDWKKFNSTKLSGFQPQYWEWVLDYMDSQDVQDRSASLEGARHRPMVVPEGDVIQCHKVVGKYVRY